MPPSSDHNFPPASVKRLYSVQEAAVYLGRTYRSIQGLVARGAIPVVRIDRKPQITPEHLDRLIDGNIVPAKVGIDIRY